MREVTPAIREWFAAGKRVVVAMLVATEGPAPRDPGATFAISDALDLAGAISGGCVESDLVAAADTIFGGGAPATFVFGPGDELDGGPTCGGTLYVVARELDRATFEAFASAETRDLPFALTLELAAPHALRVLGDEESLAGCDVEQTFVQRFGAKPRLYIIGAGDVTQPLVTIAVTLGYRVTIIEPRPAFAVSPRFPDAEMIAEWPDTALTRLPVDAADAIVSLIHDPKFDVPAIGTALRTDAGYIGAMGSRGTTARRDEALATAGFSAAERARVHGPIGLDLGARTPEEIALAIGAEIVALKRGGSARSLNTTSGPLRSRLVSA